MKQPDFKLSDQQAYVFARAIYMDISAYIQSHQEEYQEFLLQIESEEQSKDEGTH